MLVRRPGYAELVSLLFKQRERTGGMDAIPLICSWSILSVIIALVAFVSVHDLRAGPAHRARLYVAALVQRVQFASAHQGYSEYSHCGFRHHFHRRVFRFAAGLAAQPDDSPISYNLYDHNRHCACHSGLHTGHGVDHALGRADRPDQQCCRERARTFEHRVER